MRNKMYFKDMHKRKWIWLISSLFFITGFRVVAQDSLINDLKKNLFPILQTAPHLSDSDLAFLKIKLIDKQVIAIGEATHGSKEFFTLKHRIFKYLCEEMNVKIFIMEESFAIGLSINEYIHSSSNKSAEEIAKSMSIMWRTQEIADMLQWMKIYNDGKPPEQQISFYGMDLHETQLAVKWILKSLTENDTLFSKEIQMRLTKFENRYYVHTKMSYDEYVSQLKNLQETKVLIEQQFSPVDNKNKSLVLQLLNTIDQALQEYGNPKGSYQRDLFMSQNVNWIINQNGQYSKAMVWAHNEHIAKDERRHMLGYFLSLNYGTKYYSIGFVFNSGSYCALKPGGKSMLDITQFSLPVSPDGSFASILSKTGCSSFALDVKNDLFSPSTKAWLLKPQKIYQVGNTGFRRGNKWFYKKADPVKFYDNIIFLDKVSYSQFLK